MKKFSTLLLAVILMISNFVGNVQSMATAATVESKTAVELCKSANTWEEYKEIFEEFQCERGDFLGSMLKDLPKKIANSSTFSGTIGYGGIKDSEVDEFAEAIQQAIALYSETGHLRFSVKKKNLKSPYSQVDLFVEDKPLTHIGNVVKCYNIPYYDNVDKYMTGQDSNFYEGQLCYTCGVSYWNPDGTLANMEYIPYDKVAQLKDKQKPQIDKDFEGTILILLCTTDSLLGWTSLDGLYQYEDATGVMVFYNPDFIRYR